MPNADFSPPSRYRLSGKVGRAPALTALIMIFAGALIGYLVGHAFVYFETTRITDGIAILAGGFSGWLCAWLSKKSNCRNTMLVLACAGLGGLSTAWLMTVGMASGYAQQGAISTPVSEWRLATDPQQLMSTLDAIANAKFIKHRYRSGNTYVVSAGSLWFEWYFQAIAAIVTALIVARVAQARVFCETCRVWADDSKRTLYLTCPDELNQGRLESGDLGYLTENPNCRPIRGTPPLPHLRVEYEICPSCGNAGAFRIIQATQASKSFGWFYTLNSRSNRTTANLTPLLQLTPEAAKNLGVLLAREKEAKSG